MSFLNGNWTLIEGKVNWINYGIPTVAFDSRNSPSGGGGNKPSSSSSFKHHDGSLILNDATVGPIKGWDHGWLRASMDPPSHDHGGNKDAAHRRTLSWNCRRSGKISPTRGGSIEQQDDYKRIEVPPISQVSDGGSKTKKGLNVRKPVKVEARASDGACRSHSSKSGSSGNWWTNWKLRGSKSRESSPTKDNNSSFESYLPLTRSPSHAGRVQGNSLGVKDLLDAGNCPSLYISAESKPQTKERRSFFKEFRSHSKETKSPSKEKRSNFKKARSRSKELRSFFRECRSVSKDEPSSSYNLDIITRPLSPSLDPHHLSTSPSLKDSSTKSSPKDRPSSPSFSFHRPPSPCSFLQAFGQSFKNSIKSPSSTSTSLVTSPVSSSAYRVDSAILWSSAHVFNPPSLVINLDVRTHFFLITYHRQQNKY